MTELKPCPFCGGEAHANAIISDNQIEFRVFCCKCACMLTQSLFVKQYCLRSFDDILRAMDNVVEKWNRRGEE